MVLTGRQKFYWTNIRRLLAEDDHRDPPRSHAPRGNAVFDALRRGEFDADGRP